MKKIIFIIILLLITGCSLETESKEVIEKNKVIDKEEYKYVDNNPIKLGLFLYDNNYHNKSVIKDTYYTDFIPNTDIGSFEVFLTSDEVVEGSLFKDTWNKYYNMYENIDNYKIGFNIKFMLYDGTSYESNILEPDIFKYNDYFYIYLYDDIHQKDGAFYSHLEKIDDNTLLTSIKLYAVSGIDKVESIILNAFTYDEDDFDENNNYRGNSLYVIRIKRK